MMVFLRRHALYFAWAVALIGFCLSVFWGEILLHEPCSLCWYQRIALFPLTFLLGVAAYRNDSGISIYAIPLALFGAGVAFLQILERHFPALQKAGVCYLGERCASSSFSLFGWIDFPSLSATGFIAIALLLFLARQRNHLNSSE